MFKKIMLSAVAASMFMTPAFAATYSLKNMNSAQYHQTIQNRDSIVGMILYAEDILNKKCKNFDAYENTKQILTSDEMFFYDYHQTAWVNADAHTATDVASKLAHSNKFPTCDSILSFAGKMQTLTNQIRIFEIGNQKSAPVQMEEAD